MMIAALMLLMLFAQDYSTGFSLLFFYLMIVIVSAEFNVYDKLKHNYKKSIFGQLMAANKKRKNVNSSKKSNGI